MIAASVFAIGELAPSYALQARLDRPKIRRRCKGLARSRVDPAELVTEAESTRLRVVPLLRPRQGTGEKKAPADRG